MEVQIDKSETMFVRGDGCGWEVTYEEYDEETRANSVEEDSTRRRVYGSTSAAGLTAR